MCERYFGVWHQFHLVQLIQFLHLIALTGIFGCSIFHVKKLKIKSNTGRKPGIVGAHSKITRVRVLSWPFTFADYSVLFASDGSAVQILPQLREVLPRNSAVIGQLITQ